MQTKRQKKYAPQVFQHVFQDIVSWKMMGRGTVNRICQVLFVGHKNLEFDH